MTCDDVLSKLAGFDGRPGAVSKYLKVTIQYVLRRRTKALSFFVQHWRIKHVPAYVYQPLSAPSTISYCMQGKSSEEIVHIMDCANVFWHAKAHGVL